MEETNKNKEKIFPHGFIFVFTPYIIGVIMSKNVFKCEGFEKIWKGGGGGGGHIGMRGGVSGEGGWFKPSAHNDIRAYLPISLLI